jgi:hypothetical protein
MKHALLIVLLVVLMLALAGCAAGPNDAANTPNEAGVVAGFWLGLWHGIIVPITFIISLFNQNVNIYAVHNNGGWYNAGFLIGLGLFWGGGSGGACRARRRRD